MPAPFDMKLKSICCYGKFVVARDEGKWFSYRDWDKKVDEQLKSLRHRSLHRYGGKELAKISNITPPWLSGDNYTSSKDIRRGKKLWIQVGGLELLVVASQTIIVSMMPLKTLKKQAKLFLFISIKNFYYFFFFSRQKNLFEEIFFSFFYRKKNDLLSHEHRKNQKPKAHRELQLIVQTEANSKLWFFSVILHQIATFVRNL